MSRLERLLNLAAALSHTRRPMTIAEIRARVPGYSEGEPGRRNFERDKEALRDLGFDVHVEAAAGEAGYRLRPEDWTMADPGLQPDEAAALALAASIARLESDGNDPDPLRRAAGRLTGFVPPPKEAGFTARLGAASPVHGVVCDAVSRRRPVRFAYRPAEGPVEVRPVEPYGLVLRHGRWYLVGHDTGRAGVRAFRLDRIQGDVDVGEAGAFTAPDDFDPAAAVPSGAGAFPDRATTVRVVIDGTVAWWALRQLGPHRVVDEEPDGAVTVDVDVAVPDALIGFVASLLDAAEIVSPPEMREALIRHVRGAVDGGFGGRSRPVAPTRNQRPAGAPPDRGGPPNE